MSSAGDTRASRIGCDTNHAPHGSFNLYEGNVAPRFQCDGYHGSASHDTAFRNWFHGTSSQTDQFWICVNLNRFTRFYTLVGNVLGGKGPTWLAEVEDVGFAYTKHYIYSLGFPNMGNGWSNGKTAQPSQAPPAQATTSSSSTNAWIRSTARTPMGRLMPAAAQRLSRRRTR